MFTKFIISITVEEWIFEEGRSCCGSESSLHCSQIKWMFWPNAYSKCLPMLKWKEGGEKTIGLFIWRNKGRRGIIFLIF
jgi:hypothetical protein